MDKKDKERKEVENAPKQYRDLKGKHPNRCLLFRIGDFYEAYCEDAHVCHEILGIPIITTQGKNQYRMVGFHYHALDIYLPKLIRKGQRVAICDKIEEKPKKTIKDIINK